LLGAEDTDSISIVVAMLLVIVFVTVAVSTKTVLVPTISAEIPLVTRTTLVDRELEVVVTVVVSRIVLVDVLVIIDVPG
jgi:hypothetical protein